MKTEILIALLLCALPAGAANRVSVTVVDAKSGKPALGLKAEDFTLWEDKLARLENFCKKKRLPLFPISAVTGAGVEKLKYAMGKMVQEARRADAA